MNHSRRSFLKHASIGTLGIWLPRAFAETPLISSQLPRAASPEAEGISSSAISAFLKAMEETRHELHSFMMLRHGKVVSEGWWLPYAPELNHTMYSMSKSFTSTAVGFAVTEGKLSVEDKVISFFPNDLPEKVSDNLAALRVRDLLSMAVGNEQEPTATVTATENWVRTFLAQPITHAPGTVFLYNSAATYMCSAIVQKLTGQRVLDYLMPRLFEPLGITGMTWEECPRGINTGGWGLSIRSEGLAKFGQLFLQKGEWKGRQLIPAKWVEEATTFKIQQPSPAKPTRSKETNDWLQGYCYQFWRCQHNAFRGDGAFGQFTIMMPEQDAVVVMTSEMKDLQGAVDLVWQHLLPAMQDKPLPDDVSNASRLKQTLAALTLATPKGSATSTTAAAISGKTFSLEANSLGFSSVSFAFQDKACTVSVRDAKTAHVITCGIESWQLGETALPGTPVRYVPGGTPREQLTSKLAASATWKDDKTLELTLRYTETPHHDSVLCVFDGDAVKITFVNSLTKIGSKSTDRRPVLNGKLVG